MLKKLFVTAAAAAAMSVPLAGGAWADKPDDPGAGNQGVPDKATAAVVNTLSSQGVSDPVINATLDALENSTEHIRTVIVPAK